MEYQKIMLILLFTLSINASDKKPEDEEPKKPFHIFNYVYSGANSGAKNNPFHFSSQKSKIKQQKSSSFWEKLLSIAATATGFAAGSVYVIRSIFGGRRKEPNENLKQEVSQLKIMVRKLYVKETFRGLWCKMCVILSRCATTK